MNIIVNGRHLEITPALRSYSEEKIGKFEKYLSTISEAVVTLSVEKYRHKAEVLLKVNGALIQAEGVTGEIYSAIDEVVEKLEKQVVKFKEKLHSHRKGDKKPSDVSEDRQTEGGRIILDKRFDMKPMVAEEAVGQMEMLKREFYAFVNAGTGDVNVVYRRKDGNFGLIEPLK